MSSKDEQVSLVVDSKNSGVLQKVNQDADGPGSEQVALIVGQAFSSRTPKWPPFLIQAIISVGVSVGNFVVGMSMAWPNNVVGDLRLDNRTLLGTEVHLSETEKDLIGGIFFLGGVPGLLLSSFLIDAIGRKKTIISLAFPAIFGWTIGALAINEWMIYSKRFLCGISWISYSLTETMYIAEISSPQRRGALMVLPQLMVVMGLLFGSVLSRALVWYEISYVAIFIMLCYVVAIFFFPESPAYLVSIGKQEEATKILWLLKGNETCVEDEVASIYQQKSSGSGSFREFRKWEILKRMAIGIYLFSLQTYTGVIPLMTNMTRLLLIAGTPFEEEWSRIIVFTSRAAGSFVSLVLIDRLGRRRSLVLSLLVMISSLCVLGGYLHLSEIARSIGDDSKYQDVDWVPLVCILVYMFFACLGVTPVPWMMSVEMFPVFIRSKASGLLMLGNCFLYWSGNQLFSLLQGLLTTAGLIWLYGSYGLVACLFVALFLPETSGSQV